MEFEWIGFTTWYSCTGCVCGSRLNGTRHTKCESGGSHSILLVDSMGHATSGTYDLPTSGKESCRSVTVRLLINLVIFLWRHFGRCPCSTTFMLRRSGSNSGGEIKLWRGIDSNSVILAKRLIHCVRYRYLPTLSTKRYVTSRYTIHHCWVQSLNNIILAFIPLHKHNKKEWCQSNYNSTACTSIRDKAQEEVARYLYIFYSVNSAWTILFILLVGQQFFGDSFRLLLWLKRFTFDLLCSSS